MIATVTDKSLNWMSNEVLTDVFFVYDAENKLKTQGNGLI